MRIIFKDEGKHYGGKFLGIFVQRTLGSQTHVDRAKNILFQQFRRRPQLIVRVYGNFDCALGAFFDILGKLFGCKISRMRGIGKVTQFHGDGSRRSRSFRRFRRGAFAAAGQAECACQKDKGQQQT